ncbi:hypothetical protein ATSB10_23900 [Dyella thiooxydans]|uniref:DUF58 domain-containing protein n=1 Tax=Dyella thiooxydans TaxID=445710 RepID=A0A160N2J7_9GAMM|nr:DUF58 domain-containing protein [Dyella thiooxydans]AND69844.1 hypothetical protein ATSB10_23900 [Dyella thiooxydans]
MSAALPSLEADGVTQVALSELLALRARVGRMTLPTQVSRASRAGQQSSRLYGRGMDYAESRVYQRGDDVRRLDWRLTARSGKLHTKLFQEEREGRLLILLDTHASMRFGTRTRFKSVQAARAAAWAAWAAVKGAERVGLMGFGTRDELLAPRAGARGALAVCGALAAWGNRSADADEEPLSAALQRAMRTVHGASRVLLITDGACCDETARRALVELSRRARLGVLAVVDPLEVAPTPEGDYPVEHGGVRAQLHIHGERQRHWLPGMLGAGHARLAALCRATGVACRTVGTTGDPFDAVAALLGARSGR